MLVETHAFKEAFVKGENNDCYHIFETRSAAEFQMALAATGDPPRDELSVREVRVENIRDYHTLVGFKTVFLVDRDRRRTESLRVGDMPLAARTKSPLPDPRREGVRLARSWSTPASFSPKSIKSSPPSATSPKIDSTVPRRKKPPSDPFADVPFDEGESYPSVRRPAESPKPGFLARFFRFLFRTS